MPKVAGKRFSYDKKGREAAKNYKKSMEKSHKGSKKK